jgi:hypothetical protein
MVRLLAQLSMGIAVGFLLAYLTQSPGESDIERGKRAVFFMGVSTMLIVGGYYGFRPRT